MSSMGVLPGGGKPGVDAFQTSCHLPYAQPHFLGTPTQVLCIVIKIGLQGYFVPYQQDHIAA